MKSLAHFKEHPWLTTCVVALATIFSVGCSSSRSDSNATTNPLAAYETSGVSPEAAGTVINGTTVVPGSLTSPVITVTEDGSSTIEGHDNAPLLTNTHAGWQQSSCLTCHNETTNNPDHNYSDDSLCYLCHGTNGLPGLNDSTPPVLSNVAVNPDSNSVTISWKSDEDCVSRLILKTTEGDRMEFPVSTTYTTSHKYTVNGLQSNTTYYYELTCVDKSGNKTSSSSFSSAMMFKTNAATVTPVVPVNPDDPVDPDDPTTDAFIKGLKVEAKGSRMISLTFTTRETPNDLYWILYSDEACKKEVTRDDLHINDNNTYTNVNVDTYQNDGGTFWLKMMALKGSADPYYSRAVKVTLK